MSQARAKKCAPAALPRREAEELNDRMVAALPPAALGRRKYRVQDRSLRGLYVEVLESGRKTYRVRYCDSHRRQRDMRIGPADVVTAQQARRRAKEVRAAVYLGGDPAAERDRLAGIPTVKRFVEQKYMPHLRATLKSHAEYEGMLRLRILPKFGRVPLDQITPADVAAFRVALVGEGLSNGRVNRHLAVLRSALNLAQRWGCFPGPNPAASPGMLPEQGRETYLSTAELSAFLAALGADQDGPAAAALTLLALTGARKMEILAARWKDLDMARRVLVVPRSKSGRRREIVLSDAALAVIQGLSQGVGEAFLFPSARRPGKHLEDLRGAWGRAKRAAALPEAACIHTLRHSFASRLINEGESLYTVGRLLGHTQVSTTARYAHIADDTLQRAANRAALKI
jgi:integrase